MHDLGSLLKKLRLENELTQEELSNKLNSLYNIKLNKGMISKWESNKSEPRFEYIKYLSKIYNVSLDYLLGLTNYKNEKDKQINKNQFNFSEFLKNPSGINGKQYSLLKNFNNLNELGKDEAIKRIEELTLINKYTNTTISSKDKDIWEEPGKEHLMPIASHDKKGNFSDEDYKHDDDLMNNEDLWND